MFTLVKFNKDSYDLLLNGEFFAVVIPAFQKEKGNWTLGKGGRIGYFHSLQDIKHIFNINEVKDEI